MKNIKLTLYAKLLLLAAALELILGVIVFFSFHAFDTLNERDTMRRAENVMLESYRLRTEFSKKRNLKIRDEFHGRMQKFEEIMNTAVYDKNVADLLILQNDYHQLFETYVELMQNRGLNENLGVEGEFRESVHDIEDIIKKIGEKSVYVDMLQARRSEKDFIMRRKDKYVTRVNNAIESLIDNTRKLNISDEKKIEIIKLSQVYLLSFKELVRVFQRLEVHQNNLEQFEKRIRSQIETMVEDRAEKAAIMQQAQIGIVAFSVFLGVMLSIVLGRTMTRPLVELQKAAQKISEGDFDTQVEVRGNDEIAELAKTFNSMAVNIKSSNETIMDQQEQMKEQNIELELLAEDLKQSFNNLSALSNIGQSITSSLNFEDLFEKLYAELSTVIDSSTFGVGLYDEDRKTIDYQLVIKNARKVPPFDVDMNQDDRLDVMSVANKQEIFINDFESDIEHLAQDYGWAEPFDRMRTFEDDSRSAIYIPVGAEDSVIGILTIESDAIKAYKQHHLDMLRNLASYIAIAILNAKSYEEIKESHAEVKRSHEKLKRTQDQLIQAEKLASLGQLTTGIAHEIKNPLNFINNFSDGTRELCTELIEDFEDFKDNLPEEDYNYIKETVDEISGHLETIHNNGKRIDNIVKSMMEHARGESGHKVPTPVNDFIRDYVKMSYKGFCSQYKSFNTTIKHDFAESNPEATIRQQDVSRVITNIIDNACYSEYKKKQQNPNSYEPEIVVATKDIGDSVEIRIRDNGLGIPEQVLDKVFNPFFTTKPAGEGTGLGLSLSYDIITNGHSGEMIVKTEEGSYAEFIIRIPKT